MSASEDFPRVARRSSRDSRAGLRKAGPAGVGGPGEPSGAKAQIFIGRLWPD